MDEQIAHRYRHTGQGQRIERQSLSTREQEQQRQQPAPQHRVGHQAGLHPEDDYELEEDERYYTTRQPTSARRYTTSADDHVIRQGNRKFVIHDEYPPVRQRRLQPPQDHEEEPEPKPRRHMHFLVWIGAALFIMLFGWIALSALGSWWQAKQDDWTYGISPRTYQTDAVVGHNDSPGSPTHFIALNNKGQIIILELPGNDASKARSYSITTITNNDGNPPVRVSFQDLNKDGKPDMLIEIGDPGSVVTIILFNNGTEFVSKL
jgi:hypothetical protein